MRVSVYPPEAVLEQHAAVGVAQLPQQPPRGSALPTAHRPTLERQRGWCGCYLRSMHRRGGRPGKHRGGTGRRARRRRRGLSLPGCPSGRSDVGASGCRGSSGSRLAHQPRELHAGEQVHDQQALGHHARHRAGHQNGGAVESRAPQPAERAGRWAAEHVRNCVHGQSLTHKTELFLDLAVDLVEDHHGIPRERRAHNWQREEAADVAQVANHSRFGSGPLNLHGHRPTPAPRQAPHPLRMQPGAVHLGDRCGADRRVVEAGKRLVYGEAELRAYDVFHVGTIQRRALVLQPREVRHPLWRADVRPRAQPLCALQVEALQVDGHLI
mmetsp:Transcript_10377/g.34343  ORF Transcript_10377/g.34343 Transcript_10377/m.34343 type:complete len:326 (+) Transcript_10377:711-1688(+)